MLSFLIFFFFFAFLSSSFCVLSEAYQAFLIWENNSTNSWTTIQLLGGDIKRSIFIYEFICYFPWDLIFCYFWEMSINGILGTEKILDLYGPFLKMGLNCLKAIEPLRGDSLLFTDRFPGISSLFDQFWRMKWYDGLTKTFVKI